MAVKPDNPRSMRIGPIHPKGDCKTCGGQCDGDDCGLHAAGCVYGGFSESTSYWLIVEGCPLYHGEPVDSPTGTTEHH